MIVHLLGRLSRSRNGRTRRVGRVSRLKITSGRKLLLESLESRQLLSVSIPGYATPYIEAYTTSQSATPLATSSPTGFTPDEIKEAYGFDQITFDDGTVLGDGSGVTIAIVVAYDDPNIRSDLQAFNDYFGLEDSTLTIVNQDGGTDLPEANAEWATEIALDVEWVHAMAPGADILLVEADSNSLSDLFEAVDYARNAEGVVVVTMSWGCSEFSSEVNYDSYFTTPEGHEGVTFIAASGDTGSPVSYPAISSNVISVGGTSLYVDSSGTYSSETGWSGSGGGISKYEVQPDYQDSLVTQSTTYRTNPDVSYNANPSTGFAVYNTYETDSSWGQWGGTSAGAPQWAALIAIVDQGLALAGESSLDGATETLPMLYSLPSSDFHDITSGSSTGSPKYTAASGYDLVTGRGSPIANLVVADLVGSTTTTATTTHFTVTASSSTTAGATFSITVTALDSSNSVTSAYVGTVYFTSSDTGATLPSNYTFTSADNGVHTFTNVKLVLAGSQTISVFDKTNSTILGSATLKVNPGAATHLAFVQQPTNAIVGAVITPAVTVKLLDAYNNQVTTDNTDKVAISLGTNPSGAKISGTTTVTVSGGLATFNSLSVNLAGTGYTLVASCGSLTSVKSAAFNVTTKSSSAVIESFDASSTYYTAGGMRATANLSTGAKHDGTYGLLDYNGSDWIYRKDSAVQVKQGDTISVWLKFSVTADGRAYFGFGAGSSGTLSLVAAANSNQLIIQNNSGYGYTDLGAVTQKWQANRWYKLEVNWGTNGVIVGKLYDSNGTTLLNTVTASSTAFTSGGIAFRATGGNKCWDTVQLTPKANGAIARQAASTSSAKNNSAAVNSLVAAILSSSTSKSSVNGGLDLNFVAGCADQGGSLNVQNLTNKRAVDLFFALAKK
jgi:subtilase family serine protease